METGTKISAAAHVAIVAAAVFGGPLFDSDDAEALKISEVSLISEQQFLTLISNAPEITPELTAPETPTETTEPPAQETAPTTPETPEAVAEDQPDVQPDTSKLTPPDDPEIAPAPTQNLIEPQTDTLALVQPKPRPAPVISSVETPKPEAASEAETKPNIESSEAVEVPEKPADEPKEAAPDTTTESVTEADTPVASAAPKSSARPKSRPKRLKVAETPAAEDEPKDTTAEDIAKAIAAANAEITQNSGPPLSAAQQDGLVFAIQQCWNVPVGLQNAADLVVVLKVDMGPDGRLAGNPVLIEPKQPISDQIRQAFEAGRRALIRCAPYDLPQDKYDSWKQIEVVFNPQNMVIK